MKLSVNTWAYSTLAFRVESYFDWKVIMNRGVFDAEDKNFSKAHLTISYLVRTIRDETDHKYTFVTNGDASRPYLNFSTLLHILA